MSAAPVITFSQNQESCPIDCPACDFEQRRPADTHVHKHTCGLPPKGFVVSHGYVSDDVHSNDLTPFYTDEPYVPEANFPYYEPEYLEPIRRSTRKRKERDIFTYKSMATKIHSK